MSKETLPAKPEPTDLRFSTGGVFIDVDALSRAIQTLGEKFILVVPGGAIGKDLPLLHAAGISFIFPVIEKETYPIQGKAELGLSKTVLDRIAGAAGVRWDPLLCGRVDNGADPFFVEYQVAGSVLQLDGTERMISAVKRIDLRAERHYTGTTPSAEAVAAWGADAQETARTAAFDKRDPWPQILQARQHILSLAETKAKSRAIRTLGIRTAYTKDELLRGFAVVRLQFTGHSADPEVERAVSMMIAQRALQAGSILYGRRPEDRSLPPVRTVTRIVQAEDIEDEPEVKPAPQPAAPAPAPKPAASPAPTPEHSHSHAGSMPTPDAGPVPVPPQRDPLLICGPKDAAGNWPKKPASEFSSESLRGKIAYAEKGRPKWDPRWAGKNEEELAAMKAWLAFKEFDAEQACFEGDAREPGDDEVPF